MLYVYIDRWNFYFLCKHCLQSIITNVQITCCFPSWSSYEWARQENIPRSNKTDLLTLDKKIYLTSRPWLTSWMYPQWALVPCEPGLCPHTVLICTGSSSLTPAAPNREKTWKAKERRDRLRGLGRFCSPSKLAWWSAAATAKTAGQACLWENIEKVTAWCHIGESPWGLHGIRPWCRSCIYPFLLPWYPRGSSLVFVFP